MSIRRRSRFQAPRRRAYRSVFSSRRSRRRILFQFDQPTDHDDGQRNEIGDERPERGKFRRQTDLRRSKGGEQRSGDGWCRRSDEQGENAKCFDRRCRQRRVSRTAPSEGASSNGNFEFSVHLKQEEKLSVRCGRDGGVESLEVLGMIMLRVKSEEFGRIVVAVDNKESRNIQLQVNRSFSFE